MNARLPFALALSAGLVLIQQQILLRQPPRLAALSQQPIHSGSAALDLRFSRPMDHTSVSTDSRVVPALSHRWLGTNNPLRLVMDPGEAITEPVQLELAGEDLRQKRMVTQTWWWEPRPWLVVTRQVEGGEQLQLLDHDGHWRPLSPVWKQITKLTPIGNGRGVAMVSSDGEAREKIWLRHLKRQSLAQQRQLLKPPQPEQLELLAEKEVLFGHLSSNLNGDLLLQTGGFFPDSERLELIKANGQRQSLNQVSSGPMELIPSGGGLVVPLYDSLSLRPLVDNGRPAQALPGNRELGAFCAASGRAVLIRHWPDYRRSIELVIPGLAPRQLWVGEQAVLGVACDGSGERIWAVLGQWSGDRGIHSILLLNGEGTPLKEQPLAPWSMKGGTPVQFDPVSRQLLMTVIQPNKRDSHPALMDAQSLEWRRILAVDVGESQWLSP